MSFFIVFLLLTKRKKALSDKILALWIGIIGIHLLGYYLNQLDYWERYPHLIGVTAPLPLIHGPLLFLYSLYSLRGYKRFRPIDLAHFIPVVFSYLYMSTFFFLYTAEEKLKVDRGEVEDYHVFSLILLAGILISGMVYSLLAYGLTVKHRRKIDNQFSYHEGISLSWLRWCIICIGLVFFSAVMVYLLRDGLGVVFPFNPEYIIYIILILFIFYIGYFGIRHENIFVNQPQNDTGDKYRKSGLANDVSARLYQDLLRLMEKRKPYLQPRLSLSELASMLGTSTNQLSQVINQHSGSNFHDFVNAYRVGEFLENYKTNPDYSILALALESGFNSKSSFNTVFKKVKGTTPSEFLSTVEQNRN